MVLDRIRALLSPAAPGMRTSGPPTSSNGASSLHLFWVSEHTTEPVVAIGVDLEVLQTPSVDRLCFWALQATIRSGTAVIGGAHLGLQHHPDYPGGTAANWGGYHGRDSPETGELSGSPLAFPSALANPNTCNFEWVAGAAYRLEIQMRSPGRWAGLVSRIGEGDPIELRVLDCPGDRLTDFAVWTESFADCDAPGAAVRWANPTLTTASGTLVGIEHAVVNYQKVADGGCSNSDSSPARTDGNASGIVQRTGVSRANLQGSRLNF